VQQFGERGVHREMPIHRAHPGNKARAGSGQTGRDSLSNDRSMVKRRPKNK